MKISSQTSETRSSRLVRHGVKADKIWKLKHKLNDIK